MAVLGFVGVGTVAAEVELIVGVVLGIAHGDVQGGPADLFSYAVVGIWTVLTVFVGCQVVAHWHGFQLNRAIAAAPPEPLEQKLTRVECQVPIASPGVPCQPAPSRLLRYSLTRYAALWGIIPSLAGIPVATGHAVAFPAAVLAGVLLATGFAVIAVRNAQRFSWPALVAAGVLVFWPGVVWVPWTVFGALYAAFLLVAYLLPLLFRPARKTEPTTAP
jgi:hypothetical protein